MESAIRAGLIDSTKLRSKSLKDSITVVYWAGRWRRLRALLKPRWLRSMTKALLNTSCTKGCGFHALERFHQITRGGKDDDYNEGLGLSWWPGAATMRGSCCSTYAEMITSFTLRLAVCSNSGKWSVKDSKWCESEKSVICAKQHWLAFKKTKRTSDDNGTY